MYDDLRKPLSIEPASAVVSLPAPPRPIGEQRRLNALEELGAVHATACDMLNAITRLVQQQMGVQFASVNLLGSEHIWVKSVCGHFDATCVERDKSFCAWAILDPEGLEIHDARADPLFADNPMVNNAPFIRFYAGVPVFSEGEAVGTLCVSDPSPRSLSASEKSFLQGTAKMAGETLRLRASERKAIALGRLLDTALEEAYLFDLKSKTVVHASPGARRRLGYANSEWHTILPSDISDLYQSSRLAAELKHHDTSVPISIKLRTLHTRHDGSQYPVSALIAPARSNTEEVLDDLYVVVAVDIQDRLRSEQEMSRRAYYDALTGLANRYLLQDQFKKSRSRGIRSGSTLAVALIDLNRFKQINDTLGHAVGDQALVHTATVLTSAAREADTVVRLGGDEFVVLFDDLDDPSEGRRLEQRIRQALSSRVFAPTGEPLMFSLGFQICHAENANLEHMLNAADRSMYQEKNAQQKAISSELENGILRKHSG
ncbi:MAG: diguanylate cyclase [Herminiimonas sp.]|nr:diguanylate cyclase [Herminiimonas sp.]